MADNELFYDHMVDEALRGVMVKALRHAEQFGLPGDHHFYITFRTDHPRAVVSADLKARYPEEITIVLQHQYWDLKVDDFGFSVGLSFNQTPQILVVPYGAVTAFVDPSVKFGLQFRPQVEDGDGDDGQAAPEPAGQIAPTEDDAAPPTAASDNVVTLDRFRKK
jgi:uncharacterized protein